VTIQSLYSMNILVLISAMRMTHRKRALSMRKENREQEEMMKVEEQKII
jgi:hypothetical protein